MISKVCSISVIQGPTGGAGGTGTPEPEGENEEENEEGGNDTPPPDDSCSQDAFKTAFKNAVSDLGLDPEVEVKLNVKQQKWVDWKSKLQGW
jgi:hypothetical protein